MFEDLHWIDNETQEFLDGLLESIPAAPILLLFNYRPEYPSKWSAKSYYTQLRLSPLSPENAGDLLNALLGSDTSVQALKPLLFNRTEGNPFYLEESVRALMETGALSGDKGAYRLVRPIDSVDVPASVQAILAARIDRLAPEDKRLLQTAAVIGKDVPYTLLRTVAELGEPALLEGLARLQGAEFLLEASLFPDLEFTFKHALTYEVAYGGLLQQRRKTLHGKILDAIEALHEERLGERVEQLGHHALRAERWDKAAEYFRQAGVKAFDRSANREAAAAFEQALATIEHLPQTREIMEQTVDLCLALRPCVTPLADMKRVLASVQKAAPLVASLGDPRRDALMNGYHAAAQNNVGHPQEGLVLALRGIAIADSRGEPLARVSAHFFVGQSQAAMGNFRQAIESLDRDLGLTTNDLFRLAADPGAEGTLDARSSLTSRLFSRTECSLAYAEMGLFGNSLARAEEAMEIAAKIELVFFRAFAEILSGRVHTIRGEATLALPFLERGLAIARDADLPNAFIHAACGLGYANNLVGRPQVAIEILEHAWSLSQQGAFLHWGVICLSHLADAYSLDGLHTRARQAVDQALTIVRDAGYRAREAWALYIQGNILARASGTDSSAVERAHWAALGLANELEMCPLAAHCHLALGRLFGNTKRSEEAREHLSKSLAMYRDMDMHHWPEQAEAALRVL